MNKYFLLKSKINKEYTIGLQSEYTDWMLLGCDALFSNTEIRDDYEIIREFQIEELVKEYSDD